MRAAVIGAGMAAAALAKPLKEAGWQLEFFEKSRGTGGRMATRRGESVSFDHGAQYFTARTSEFSEFLAPYIREGLVQDWTPHVQTLSPSSKPFKRLWYEPHYVSVPTMNALCKRLLADESVRLQHRVERVQSDGVGWQLVFEDGSAERGYDWVISTAPAPQAMLLFAPYAEDLETVQFDPGFAVMGLLSGRPGWDAAVVRDSAVNWIVCADARPGRPEQAGLIAQASGDWAAENLEEPKERVLQRLLQSLAELNLHLSEPQLHRWRFARTRSPLGKRFWLDADRRLAACGDWCLGDSIEDAYLSAVALTEELSQGHSDLYAAQHPRR